MIDRIKTRLLDLVVAPYVECPNCKALCEYGKDSKTCWACEAELVINETTTLVWSFMQKSARDRPYTAYVRCPNCRRLLNYGTDFCPHCREELNEEYSFVSSFFEVLNTTACNEARTIASFNPYAVIVVVISVTFVALEVATGEIALSYVLPFMSIVPLLAVLLWFYRFGGIDDNDEDFVNAKREAKRALKLWLLIFAAQLFLVFLLIFPH